MCTVGGRDAAKMTIDTMNAAESAAKIHPPMPCRAAAGGGSEAALPIRAWSSERSAWIIASWLLSAATRCWVSASVVRGLVVSVVVMVVLLAHDQYTERASRFSL